MAGKAQSLTVKPAIGRRPVLANCRTEELNIDAQYQRSIELRESSSLIRRIATSWDWSLCQPLVVARRPDGSLWVIDGQHRLAASRLRGDITDLPCVVIDSDGAIDEAASFVALNSARRALSPLDVFRAALASGDEESRLIMAALERHGLSLITNNNLASWKPGQLGNVAALRTAWRRLGERRFNQSLAIIARAFDGQVLRYGASLYAAIVGVMVNVGTAIDIELLTMVLQGSDQVTWMQEFARAQMEGHADTRGGAAVYALRTAYGEALAESE